MNSRRKDLDKAHRIASEQAREMACLCCYVEGCVPAHIDRMGYPKHRGMGGGKAGWGTGEWQPLCVYHHDLIDGRLGVSQQVEFEREIARRQIVRTLGGEE